MHKSKQLPFNHEALTGIECFYEVKENGQVFRTLYKGSELIAEAATSDSAVEAAFAAQYFTGLSQYKLHEEDNKSAIDDLPMAEAVKFAAETFFVELAEQASVLNVTASVATKEDAVPEDKPAHETPEVYKKPTFMQRVRYFLSKLLKR